MFRIDHATAVGTLPTPTAEGTPGYYINVNPSGPSAGTGTYIDATWLNAVQEELIAILAAAGVTADKLDGGGALVTDQVIQAVRRLAGANVTSFAVDTALTADHAGIVLVDATAGNIALTLPAVNGAGGAPLRFAVVRVDNAAHTVTVTPAGSDALWPGTAANAGIGGTETVLFQGLGATAWWCRRTRPSAPVVHAAGSGNDTVPAGYTLGRWQVTGPGGGAAGCDGTFAGGGGGAGGTAIKQAVVAPGAVYAWVVAAGGAGGTGGADGSDGAAASTVSGTGVSLSAGAGLKGTYGAAPAGGDGGAATGGDINLKGGAGTDGYPSGIAMGGNGGASFWGGGGRAATNTNATVQNGHAPGSGAGAGYNAVVNGGAGADGIAAVQWLP